MASEGHLTAVEMERTVDILGRTIFGEARGEPWLGQVAVAWVVRNRVARPSWWGRSYVSVCLKPAQFSCWNTNDPNLEIITRALWSDLRFLQAIGIAAVVIAGGQPDPTKGATHYHSLEVHPYWAGEMDPVVEIGRHIFYRERPQSRPAPTV